MKKLLAFVLTALMLISLCVFTGCSDNSEKTSTSDEVSDAVNSSLAGEWKVESTDDEVEWFMNPQETLHITETRDGQKYTTVCRYIYDKDTKTFEYVGLSANTSFKGTITREGSVMMIKSIENDEVVILSKIS